MSVDHRGMHEPKKYKGTKTIINKPKGQWKIEQTRITTKLRKVMETLNLAKKCKEIWNKHGEIKNKQPQELRKTVEHIEDEDENELT